MILLIDGYNLIFTQPPDRVRFTRHPESIRGAGFNHPGELETLRDNLVSQLKSYNIKKKYRIIVVFDGDKTNTHYPEEKESGGIRVVFSQGKTTADEHIINLISSYIQEKPHRQDLCVVTSDRDLAETLSNNRVRIISSQEFATELTIKSRDTSPDLKGEPFEKFTGLKPSDVPKWLKMFSKEEHE